MQDFQLQTPHAFFQDIIQEARHASRKIWLQAMFFEYGPLIDALSEVLIMATKRGVDVRLTIDWVYTRSIHGNVQFFPIHKAQTHGYEHLQKTKNILDKLTTAGVRIHIINQPLLKATPLAHVRRNHRKLIIIDDYSWIGGINLMDTALQTQDFMVKFFDKRFQDIFSTVFLSANKKANKNAEYFLGNDSKLLVDNGIFADSLIYQKAVSLVKHAKKNILFISQILPDGALLQEMQRQKSQDISIKIITSPKDSHPFTKFPDKFLYRFSLKRIQNNPHISLYYSTKYVHAKVLLVDDTYLLFGSHNLVWISSLIGTEEIALYTQNADLIRQCQTFIQTL